MLKPRNIEYHKFGWTYNLKADKGISFHMGTRAEAVGAKAALQRRSTQPAAENGTAGSPIDMESAAPLI